MQNTNTKNLIKEKAQKYLSSDYIPKKLLHREKQINEVTKIIKAFKKSKYCGKHFLFKGLTGSGKTITAQFIKKIFNDDVLYVNCLDEYSPSKILNKLTNSNIYNNLELTQKI